MSWNHFGGHPIGVASQNHGSKKGRFRLNSAFSYIGNDCLGNKKTKMPVEEDTGLLKSMSDLDHVITFACISDPEKFFQIWLVHRNL